jgi:lipopolysaccharide export LptBFGC system permease protein LptF
MKEQGYSEFYLYGEIYQEGGKNPNLYINTKEYGNLVISATKKQIMESEKKTYKLFGVKVRGKKSLEVNSITNLKLIEFIQYTPTYNKDLLDRVIKKASQSWNKIPNIDTWLANIRVEEV